MLTNENKISNHFYSEKLVARKSGLMYLHTMDKWIYIYLYLYLATGDQDMPTNKDLNWNTNLIL